MKLRDGALVALLGFNLVGVAHADNDNDFSTEDIPRVVPYDGVINLDGVGLTGTVDVLFTLYDAPDGGNAVWSEAWSTAEGRPVSVRAGRFSVNLGTYEGISDVIADAGRVYLGIQIKQPESENYVALGGRQRLNPVPYALWTAHATDLAVGGTLSVAGDATARDVTATRDVTAARGVIAGRYQLPIGNNVPAVLSFTNDYVQLGPSTVANAGSGVRVTPPLRVDSTSNLRGNVDVDANLNVDGTTRLRGSVDADGSVNVDGTLTVANIRPVAGGDRVDLGDLLVVNNIADGDANSALVISDSDGLEVDDDVLVHGKLRFQSGNTTYSMGGLRYTNEVSNNGGNGLALIPTSAGVCFFTHVGGVPNGDSCSISAVMSAGQELWVLQSDDGGCKARCLRWD